MANSNALADSSVNESIDVGLRFVSGIGTFNLGSLSGGNLLVLSDTAGSPVTLSVGGNGQSTNYVGSIIGNGGLAKVDAGTLTLTALNTYSGATTVDGGTISLPGGSLASPVQYVGYSATGSFTQSGGTNTPSSALYLGFNAGSSGSYTLSGGSLYASAVYVGYSGSGGLTQTGGTNSAGGLELGQGTTGSYGAYNLNGGLLLMASAGITQGFGGAAFNFGGGTLGAAAPWSSSVNMTLPGSGGNSTVDSTGGSIAAIGQPDRFRHAQRGWCGSTFAQRDEFQHWRAGRQRWNSANPRRCAGFAHAIRRLFRHRQLGTDGRKQYGRLRAEDRRLRRRQRSI